MNRRYCDHCGYDVTDGHRLHQVSVKYTPPVGQSTRWKLDTHLDLCVDCAKAVMEPLKKTAKPKAES